MFDHGSGPLLIQLGVLAWLSRPTLRFFTLAEQCHTQNFYLRCFKSDFEIWFTHLIDWENDLKIKDDLKNEDDHKNEDDLKNEDGLKNEDDLKNELALSLKFFFATPPLKNYLHLCLMTSHCDSHTTTEILPGV